MLHNPVMRLGLAAETLHTMQELASFDLASLGIFGDDLEVERLYYHADVMLDELAKFEKDPILLAEMIAEIRANKG